MRMQIGRFKERVNKERRRISRSKVGKRKSLPANKDEGRD